MEPADYREAIYDIFSEPETGFESRINQALDVGTDYLELPIGFMTEIREGTQAIVHATGDHPLIRPGETCPLDQAYCRRTIELDGTLAVQDASVSTAIADAAVETFELGTYIGAKVVVDDDTYGTVCFAAGDRRDRPFTEAEEIFVELIARLTGQTLERQAYREELERRNEQLATEKRRFEAIAETSYDILFRVGTDGTFTYVSQAVERVLGYAPEALTGVPFGELMSVASMEDAQAAFAETLEGETVENRELEFVDADGDPVLIEVNATPITENGAIVGVQGVGRDITVRKEREQELRLKNRAMDDAEVGILIADVTEPDTPVIYANDGVSRLTGRSESELLGQPFRTVLGGSSDADAAALFEERIPAREPIAIDLINRRADGTPFWNQIRATPIENDAGEVRHYLGFQTDVTDRKRIEQLLNLLNRVLRHNLRNDMNVIQGFGSMIHAMTEGDVASYAERIQENASRLTDLSEKAREIERYARYERAPTRIDTGTLLDGVVTECRAAFPDATIDLCVRTDVGICAGAEIERAVTELVENALKHNPAPAPWVGIEADNDGRTVRITIEDDGPGIDAMEAKVIAEGEETALEHGSGLGLWLVNWIVTRYGGSFQIGMDGDGGTTARLRLPGIDAETPVTEAARRPTTLFQ